MKNFIKNGGLVMSILLAGVMASMLALQSSATRGQREKVQLLVGVLEHIKFGLVQSDLKGEFTIWTSEAEALLGYTEHDMVGESVSTLIPSKYLAAHLKGYDRGFETTSMNMAHAKEIVCDAVKKDGEEVRIRMYVWVSEGRANALIAPARHEINLASMGYGHTN